MPARPVIPSGRRERRRVPRVRAGTGRRIAVTADEARATLIDLSHAGCAVETTHRFAAGDELYLTFTLDTCLSFVVPVRVMYVRPSGTGPPGGRRLVGFAFVIAKQPDIHRVVEILLEAIDEHLPVH